MEDRVRKVFRYVLFAFGLAIVIFSFFEPDLTYEIFGIPLSSWRSYLFLGLVLAFVGWEVVLWFRKRGE